MANIVELLIPLHRKRVFFGGGVSSPPHEPFDFRTSSNIILEMSQLIAPM